ncbi:hypothetical protein AcW1_004560 [Taiwanofungus camphoratus]|nr:hypothetical protein AcW2_006435 [Antrodia cinnamomea]KAI0939568.1 hypothetical protein AcV5_000945 [Antrodia cinnamomea]KAI0952488.1 hypothetical protein AcV7_008275 [Antrodia cinnamomea]KAI0959859.1 hypothetical protein AcW1_004560 [Antrodia cinnamomea]
MASYTFAHNMKEAAQGAIQANKDHQYSLKVYTERLEAELETVAKLLAAADVSEHEDELEVDAGGNVLIRGSVKAVGPISSSDLLAENSPFLADAMTRQRYLESTVIHSMKGPELDALTDAVRSENHRIHALESQLRGQQPFVSLDDHPPGYFELNKAGIDWERVAMKVSSSGPNVQRSAKECEIRWLGERHPQFNHTQWTQPEITKVKELVDGVAEGQVDWMDIAAKLGTRRTPVDCMRHAITRRTHVWSPEADERLMEAVRIYGTDNWILVARWVSEDATASQCQNRYMRSLDPEIKRGPWTEEEDNKLRRAVEVFGRSWIEVANFIPGRNNEQCRDRYQENLNPSIAKGKWTPEEDKALLLAVEQVGEAKWKVVSKLLGTGRTDSMCRTRYGKLKKSQQSGAASPLSRESPASALSSTTQHDGSQISTVSRGVAQTGSHLLASTSAATLQANSQNNSSSSTIERPRPRPHPRRKNAGNQIDQSEVIFGSAPANTGTIASPGFEAQEDVSNAGKEKEKGTTSKDAAKKQPRGRPPKSAKRKESGNEAEKPPPNKRRRTLPEEEHAESMTGAPTAESESTQAVPRESSEGSRGHENPGVAGAQELVDATSAKPPVAFRRRGRPAKSTEATGLEVQSNSTQPSILGTQADQSESCATDNPLEAGKCHRKKAIPLTSKASTRKPPRLASKRGRTGLRREVADAGNTGNASDVQAETPTSTRASRKKGSLQAFSNLIEAPDKTAVTAESTNMDSSELSSPPSSP